MNACKSTQCAETSRIRNLPFPVEQFKGLLAYGLRSQQALFETRVLPNAVLYLARDVNLSSS
jgi:hypothetical protein